MLFKIELEEQGRINCHIYIKPLNGIVLQPIRFKLDTGADFSTISRDVLDELGYDMPWIEDNLIKTGEVISTASGDIVNSYLVQLPLINIFGFEGLNWPFGILLDVLPNKPKQDFCNDCEHTKLKRLDYRCLLGRDLLAGFDYTVSNKTSAFILEKLPVFPLPINHLPGQEIHAIDTNGLG